jgi:hypothetical protein
MSECKLCKQKDQIIADYSDFVEWAKGLVWHLPKERANVLRKFIKNLIGQENIMVPWEIEDWHKHRPDWVMHKDTGGLHRVLRIRGIEEDLTKISSITKSEEYYDVIIKHDCSVYDYGYCSVYELYEHYRLPNGDKFEKEASE